MTVENKLNHVQGERNIGYPILHLEEKKTKPLDNCAKLIRVTFSTANHHFNA